MSSSLSKKSEYEAVNLDESWTEKEIRKPKWSERTVTIRLPTLIVAFFVQVLIVVIIIWINMGRRERQNPHSIGYYPATEAVRYHEVVFDENKDFWNTNHDSPPSKEVDDKWKEIQAPVDGVVEASYDTGFDLSKLQHSITSAVDHKYHMYGLDVFHQLHCLDRIRMSFYPDHYFANETQKEIIHHREHCIDHIRQGIMCSGDIALDRWYWDKEDKKSYLLTDVPHVCRDFNMLSDWVKDHKYRPEDWIKQYTKEMENQK